MGERPWDANLSCGFKRKAIDCTFYYNQGKELNSHKIQLLTNRPSGVMAGGAQIEHRYILLWWPHLTVTVTRFFIVYLNELKR